MRKLFTLLAFVLLGFFAFSQNSSPLMVNDFKIQPDGIVDLEQIPRDARVDWDGNPICMIMVEAVGFDASLMQKFTFLAENIYIMHKTIKDGMVVLYVSSNKNGEIIIKYLGDMTYTLPYKLEAGKVYDMMVGMRTSTLIIHATPLESEIYVDGEKIGVGAVNSQVSIGQEHKYKVTCQDYYSEEGVVEFSNVETKEINISLEPNFGLITVTSEPIEADVYVDGKNVGKTPYVSKKISRGTHRVELKKDRYNSFVKVVKIRAGETNNEIENVSLVPKELKFGALTINSTPDGADVTVDGKVMGKTPMTLSDLLIGNHSVVLNHSGYFSLTEHVVVIENDTTTLNLKLLKGQEITISSDKDGDRIFIDGKYAGLSPVKTILTAGPHDVVSVRGGSGEALYDLLKNIDVHYQQEIITVQQSTSPISAKIAIPVYNQTVDIDGISVDMIGVAGGSFMMGNQYRVDVADFHISKFEVTQGLWKAVMGSLPKMDYYDDKLPVSNINWYDAVEFCNKLSQKCGMQPYYSIEKTGQDINVSMNYNADGFRLPTEKEWEYAARGGRMSKGYKYSGSDNEYNVSWFDVNSGDEFFLKEDVDYGNGEGMSVNRLVRKIDKINNMKMKNHCRTHPVGLHEPNELGIFDMSGNVMEWCEDISSEMYAKTGDRVLRGGSFWDNYDYGECTRTFYNNPSQARSSYGLRIAYK